MDKIFKKSIAVIMSMAVLLTMLPSVMAKTVAVEEQPAAEVLNQETTEEQQFSEPGSYNLLRLSVEKKVATVEYEALEDATIIVAIYSEDGQQMLASATAPAPADKTVLEVALEGTIPTYFQAAAFLVRTMDLVPLCSPLKTSLYTKPMQQLLKSTVDSYPQDRVINLDDDKTTNFVVLREGVLQIESTDTENRFVSIDRENNCYVVENADAAVDSLKSGDVFVHNGTDGWIVAKVVSVQKEGTRLTIQGETAEATDAFSHVKMETQGTVEDMTFDPQTLGENVAFQGLVQQGQQRAATMDVSGEDETVVNIPLYAFEITLKAEADSDLGEVEAEAKIIAMVGIQAAYNCYLAENCSVTDMRISGGIFLNGGLEGSVKMNVLSLGEWKWEPLPGVISAGFEPFASVELSGEATLDVSVNYNTTVYYDKEAESFSCSAPKPEANSDAKIDGELFVGIDFNPTVELLEGILVDLDLTAMLGVFFIGELTGTKYGEVAEPPTEPDAEKPNQLHSCERCYAGEIHYGVKVGYEAKILNWEILGSKKSESFSSYKLQDFYWCLSCMGTHPVQGKGYCPQRRFLVTVEALDEQGDPIANAKIVADGSASGLPVKEMGVTNENGVVSNYIPAGLYTFCVGESSQESRTIEITGSGKVRIDGSVPIFSPNAPGYSLSPVIRKLIEAGQTVGAGKCGENATWTLTENGFLKIEGYGKIEEKPWHSTRIDVCYVQIDDRITDIGDFIFAGQDKLYNITLPSALKTIGEGAFSRSAIKTVIIPEGVTSIGDEAFYECRELTSVSLPDSLESLGEEAFSYSNLKTVILPRGLTEIAPETFHFCRSLEAVSIPNTVTKIGEYAFDTTSLEEVYLHDTVTSIGKGCFYQNYALESLRLPSALTEIPAAFAGKCSGLESITIPQTVTKIGSGAFSGAGLTSANLPGGLTVIESYLFRGCENLEYIDLPNGIVEIQDGAFENCKSLTRFSIPDGVTDIPGSCFSGCTMLSRVSIPDSVKTFGASCFANCMELTSIDIPEGTTCIGMRAFSGCDNLSSLVIPRSVKTMEHYVIADSYHTATDETHSHTVYFEGDAPEWGQWLWCRNMTIYYPAGNATWTEEFRSSVVYKGEDCRYTWVAYDPGTVSATDISAKATSCNYTQAANTNTVKVAEFTDLTPGQEYLMLVVQDAQAEQLLAADNLLYVAQLAADKDGKISHNYICRTDAGISFVLLFGGLEQNLKDATVTFPQMEPSDQEKAVDPVVTYNGKTLVEGIDYRIEGDVTYTKAGTYTITIYGINQYSGSVECSYTVTDVVRGDLDGDGLVNNKDVEYLLWYTLFPANYPVDQDADFDSDGNVNNKDVEYLLWHTLFPQNYPLR